MLINVMAMRTTTTRACGINDEPAFYRLFLERQRQTSEGENKQADPAADSLFDSLPSLPSLHALVSLENKFLCLKCVFYSIPFFLMKRIRNQSYWLVTIERKGHVDMRLISRHAFWQKVCRIPMGP